MVRVGLSNLTDLHLALINQPKLALGAGPSMTCFIVSFFVFRVITKL